MENNAMETVMENVMETEAKSMSNLGKAGIIGGIVTAIGVGGYAIGTYAVKPAIKAIKKKVNDVKEKRRKSDINIEEK